MATATPFRLPSWRAAAPVRLGRGGSGLPVHAAFILSRRSCRHAPAGSKATGQPLARRAAQPRWGRHLTVATVSDGGSARKPRRGGTQLTLQARFPGGFSAAAARLGPGGG